MKKLVGLLFSISFLGVMVAQPSIEWKKTFGGSYWDIFLDVHQTSDGGYIAVGATESINGDVSGNHGSSDVWVVKMSSTGGIQWKKALGGTGYDAGSAIVETKDGGFILMGFSDSHNGQVSGNHGNYDFWVVKLSNLGAIEWQKSLGGSMLEYGFGIQQTNDNGYILIGYSISNDGDVSGNHGLGDIWVVKLSNLGVLQWQKTLGGSNDEGAACIKQTSDGGYILAGSTLSDDGDVVGQHGGGDIWLVKLSEFGDIQWQKTYGGSKEEALDQTPSALQITADSGYILSGRSYSDDGDVSGGHGVADAWIVKLSQEGNLQWQKTLGGSKEDVSLSIQQTQDGGFITAGITGSFNGDVTGNHGEFDYWVIKLSSSGEKQWQKALGGTKTDYAYSILQSNDGGYLVSGLTESINGDVTGNHGGYDAWVVKLNPVSVDVEEAWPTEIVTLFPNPANQMVYVSIAPEEIMMSISISDLQGQQISQQTIQNGGGLEVSSLPNGMYSIVATTPSGRVFSAKFNKVE